MSQGHGHVNPRDDGTKARCGGPNLCSVCQLELLEKDDMDCRKMLNGLAQDLHDIAEQFSQLERKFQDRKYVV